MQDKSHLPITELVFRQDVTSEMGDANVTLGPLTCFGSRELGTQQQVSEGANNWMVNE